MGTWEGEGGGKTEGAWRQPGPCCRQHGASIGAPPDADRLGTLGTLGTRTDWQLLNEDFIPSFVCSSRLQDSTGSG